MMRAFLGTIGLWLATTGLSAQAVMVSPPAIFLDDGRRTDAITLVNRDRAPVEVTISFFYGYPVTNGEGHVLLRTFEAVPDTAPSAADWLEILPARLVLEPGERRAVRLRALPPQDLASGEYWARVMVSTRGRPVQMGTASRDDIGITLDLEVRSVLALLYRRGNVDTGIQIDDIETSLGRDTLRVRPWLARSGNAAFLGTAHVALRDSDARVVRRAALPLGVYYSLAPEMAFPLDGLSPGQYEVEVSVTPRRTDVRPGALLPGPQVSKSMTIQVP